MKKVNNGIIKLEKNVRGDIMKKILFIVFLMVCVFLVGCSTNNAYDFVFSEITGGGYAVEEYKGSDTNVIIPAIYNSQKVTFIDDEAFQGRADITCITIPDSVTSIGRFAFSGCSSLTNITIPDSVSIIGDSAFSGCTSLTYNEFDNGLYLGNEKNPYLVLDKVENINISTVTINNRTRLIMGAFGNCTSLTSITIPDSVISIGAGAFNNCYNLISINIPDSVTSIGVDAFNGFSILTNITIPDSVISISNGTFYDCSILTRITIPDKVTSIGLYAFFGCSSLTSITIPDSVTSIGGAAFTFCSSLTSIIIPNSVTSIGEYAFNHCTSLTIYCKASSQPSGWDPNWNSSNRPVVWGY